MLVWVQERTQTVKAKRHMTEEKIHILRETETGRTITEVCREWNISEVTFHRWKKQFGPLDVNEARRLKELERENTEIKKLLAEVLLAKRVLEFAVEKNYEPEAQKVGDPSRSAWGGAPGVTHSQEARLIAQLTLQVTLSRDNDAHSPTCRFSGMTFPPPSARTSSPLVEKARKTCE